MCPRAYSSQEKPWNPGWHEHRPDCPSQQLSITAAIQGPNARAPQAENTTGKCKGLLSITVLALDQALEFSMKLELYKGIEVQGIPVYNHL